ncbi:cytochrome P450 [Pluteus cervinus]|uniref:Cytochrome P450 n=1 Tax=Pluteus cervinus TaxID=181527 RepID=A0ACD3B651_9AGAR|nr:cytochrome P450 [Pluteus cervinus]
MTAPPSFEFFSTELYVTAAVLGFVALLYSTLQDGRKLYPPGPLGLPVFGMMFHFPQNQPWIQFREWSKKYNSDAVSIEVLGQRTVVLNSSIATQELMVKRSAIYSDRPALPMLNDLLGWNWNFAFMRYGATWKEHRKLFQQEVQHSLAHFAQPHALAATHRLLGSILTSPEGYIAHLKHLAGYFALSSAYGLDIKPSGDPYVEIAEKANEGPVKAASFPPYLVDTIPALKYIPAWFPGAQFKRDARVWAEFAEKLLEVPFQAAKERYVQGTGKPCIASRGLEEIRSNASAPHQEEQELNLKSVLGVFYSAGVESTLASLSTFVLAMVLHPEVQKTAQRAIVEAVGDNRLPEFDDIQSIPYLQALVKEVFRWQPAIPLAIPHTTTADDYYQGYFIPKGSTVIGNAWAILQDESIFGEDTHLFKPERFLTEDGTMLNPSVPNPDVAFGFGRRACPGRFLAERLIIITAASLLHCFEISKVKAKDETEISPVVEYTTGMISYPKPFACDFKVRSAKLKEIIQDASQDVGK